MKKLLGLFIFSIGFLFATLGFALTSQVTKIIFNNATMKKITVSEFQFGQSCEVTQSPGGMGQTIVLPAGISTVTLTAMPNLNSPKCEFDFGVVGQYAPAWGVQTQVTDNNGEVLFNPNSIYFISVGGDLLLRPAIVDTHTMLVNISR